MEDIAELIVLVIVFLLSTVGAILKKINEWINERRMKVDRHPPKQEDVYVPRRVAQSASARPATTTAAPSSEPQVSEAELILQQLEMMLPPEIREARQRARREASSRQAQASAPVEQPAQRTATPPSERRPIPPPVQKRPAPQPVPQRPQQPRPSQPQRAPQAPPQRRPQPVAAPAPKQSPAPKPAPAVAAARVMPVAIAPPGQAMAYELRQQSKSILENMGVHGRDELRRVFLLQEILKGPVSEVSPTPYF